MKIMSLVFCIALSSLLLAFAQLATAQTAPYYQVLSPLPEAVTNNAVTEAMVNDTPFVYTFMGLDSTKIWSGIHRKAWRLNVLTNQWTAVASVPDPAGGRIAAGASTVKGLIYLVGGYHVAQNGSETSSNKLHRFDPNSNAWLADGAVVPKSIDDHVQAVWRDSLIYVITGWSNTANVANVQIYNPSTDTWMAGTPLPNTTDYKAFGASGTIKGDSIFYIGGAKDGTNFPAAAVLRKGYINPDNPAQITWSAQTVPLAKGYRMAAARMAGGLVWFGGSDVTYNYNGIAYNGSGSVPALARAKTYYDLNGLGEINASGLFPNLMDLRGVGQISPDYFITVGGMGINQKVTNQVYGFSWAVTLDAEHLPADHGVQVMPNPVNDALQIIAPQILRFHLLDAEGQNMRSVTGSGTLYLSTSDLPNGAYFLQIWQGWRLVGVKKVVVVH